MRILITGATGLVGESLVDLFHENNVEVNYLTTSKNKIKNKPNYRGYFWNPSRLEIDKNCFDGVSAIINLAGASVAKRWTKNHKKAILDSRIDSLNTLKTSLEQTEHQVEHLLSASAIGLYKDSLTKFHEENDYNKGNNYLADVVSQWESAADEFNSLGIKVSKVRIGVVLAKNGGALEKMKQPVEKYVGAPLGHGKQWQSWIHVVDLCGIFYHLLERQLEGVYNAVSPNPVSNKELTECIAKELGKPLVLPNVPSFVLKLMLGEMSTIVLGSQLVSSQKIINSGFQFKYAQLKPAMSNLL